MSDREQFIDQVVILAGLHVRSNAIIYQTPAGIYAVSRDDGTTGSAHNTFVCSRTQLAEIMWQTGIRWDHLTDRDVTARLATAVLEASAQRVRDHAAWVAANRANRWLPARCGVGRDR